MRNDAETILNELLRRWPALGACRDEIAAAYAAIAEAFERGNKLLLCGNGGSAADCGHIVGELMKRFKRPRPLAAGLAQSLSGMGADGAYLAERCEGALAAISLVAEAPLLSAVANDMDAGLCYAQQVSGLGRRGDVLLAISTSGNAVNCRYAAVMARAVGMRVVALTGGAGGRLAEQADIRIAVPETETFRVQELHLPVYHALCAMLEARFWPAAE